MTLTAVDVESLLISSILRDVFREWPLLVETRKARERQAEGEPGCADRLALAGWGWGLRRGWRWLSTGVGHVGLLWEWFEPKKDETSEEGCDEWPVGVVLLGEWEGVSR